MGVLVCYDDFTYDVIDDYHLKLMVETKCISGYDASGYWIKKEEGHTAAQLTEARDKDPALTRPQP